MRTRPALRTMVAAGATLAMATSGAASAASVSDACPATMAQAQAMLQRQGRLPGGTGYPQRYSPARVTVLGAAAASLYVAHEPNAIWSFTYELQPPLTLNLRRAFETSPPRGPGFTYNCPASSQCRWSASGFGNAGPQPQHALGQLLEVDMRRSYSSPGSYSLACLYLNRRPVRR